ncbi:urotensin II-related peptide [Acipenser oxyrinchus oxyrinchus]|uniref:Urotensin II-related peptide n=1 Tax=Acipenser oxyrinchus oxyrinchus TaxID=40147 RepID=A0AAD8LM14_ACIOX|nr:urotensin II-related peptide [Acipenser oxyrinchus oxyrinchus]
MQPSVVLSFLIATVTFTVRCSPVGSQQVQSEEDERKHPDSVEIHSERRGKILRILTALEESRKSESVSSKLSAQITGARANTRTLGRRAKMFSEESQVAPTPSSQDEGSLLEFNDELSDPRYLGGRSFKKSVPPPAKKPKKRACFWKYCVQN